MLLLAAERLQRLCGFPVFFVGGVASVFNGIVADLLQRPTLGEFRRRTAQFKIIEHEMLPVVEQARCDCLTLMLLDETQFHIGGIVKVTFLFRAVLLQLLRILRPFSMACSVTAGSSSLTMVSNSFFCMMLSLYLALHDISLHCGNCLQAFHNEFHARHRNAVAEGAVSGRVRRGRDICPPRWEPLEKFAFPWSKSADELRILSIRFYDQIRRILGLPCALCAGDIVIAEFVHTLPRIDRVPVTSCSRVCKIFLISTAVAAVFRLTVNDVADDAVDLV